MINNRRQAYRMSAPVKAMGSERALAFFAGALLVLACGLVGPTAAASQQLAPATAPGLELAGLPMARAGLLEVHTGEKMAVKVRHELGPMLGPMTSAEALSSAAASGHLLQPVKPMKAMEDLSGAAGEHKYVLVKKKPKHKKIKMEVYKPKMKYKKIKIKVPVKKMKKKKVKGYMIKKEHEHFA